MHEDDAVVDAVAEEACSLLDTGVLGCLGAAVEGSSFTGAAFGSLTATAQRSHSREVSSEMRDQERHGVLGDSQDRYSCSMGAKLLIISSSSISAFVFFRAARPLPP